MYPIPFNVSLDNGTRPISEALFPDFLEDERFIVWMRVAAYVSHRSSALLLALDIYVYLYLCRLPTFRKLWGIIRSDVPAGTYSLAITNRAFPKLLYLVLFLTLVLSLIHI